MKLMKFEDGKLNYIDTTINIMGEKWRIVWSDDEEVFDDCFGITYGYTNIILMSKLSEGSQLDWVYNQKRVLRHEILHAYLFSCGLVNSSNSCEHWADNEEMVDWFARISPKIFDTYKELGLI